MRVLCWAWLSFWSVHEKNPNRVLCGTSMGYLPPQYTFLGSLKNSLVFTKNLSGSTKNPIWVHLLDCNPIYDMINSYCLQTIWIKVSQFCIIFLYLTNDSIFLYYCLRFLMTKTWWDLVFCTQNLVLGRLLTDNNNIYFDV